MQHLITGGDGFIGRHLAKTLKERGENVTIYDKTQGNDVLDSEKLNEAVGKADIVFHLAGLLGTHELVDNAVEAAQINIIGTLNVLNACRDNNVKLVEISKPNCWNNTYTITKIAAESFTKMYQKEFGLEAITIKWFNVYGPGQPLEEEIGYKKLIPTAIMSALKNEPIEIYGNGEQTMDLIHTTDTAEATLSLVDNWDKCKGDIYEIGSGEETKVNDVAKKIAEINNVEIKHVKMRKGETDNTSLCADISKISKLTGWKPRVSLDEGLLDTINYYKKKL